ncbi:MAG: sugar ABC transporter permease [Turicibacter sp.]|nr:sugar ABC transporter permease [Turicibacter sp.]
MRHSQSTIKDKTDISALNNKSQFKEVITHIALYTELIIMSVIVLFPILWIVGSSFNPGNSLASSRFIPQNPTLNHYINLIQNTNYLRWYWNTFKIAVITMVINVFLSTSLGYIFGRFNFKFKKTALLSVMILQIFPSFMAMTALYVLFLTFNLLDNHWALILLYSAGQIPFNTWLIKGYLSSVPKELDESAMLDGASKFQTFRYVVFPLMKPIISFVAVTNFMVPWMDFIFPRLIISTNSNFTLAIGLFDMINGNASNQYTSFAAGAVLVALPITCIYVFLQKYLIEGIMAGASKG